jgi:hypothetical protein
MLILGTTKCMCMAFICLSYESHHDQQIPHSYCMINIGMFLIAHFRYIKYSASLRDCEAVKLNTKEIES